jgi:gliding motility-associated-like protein
MKKGMITPNNKTIKRSIVYLSIFAFFIIYFRPLPVCSQNIVQLQPQNSGCQVDVLEIPNAFSPNNDGINDKWEPLYKDSIDSLNVKVYGKYGELVFEENKINFSWDGKDKKGRPCDAGLYVFIIDYRIRGNMQQCKGGVSLIR